jgi:serine/threonine protein kinase
MVTPSYKIEILIGSGVYGKVFKARNVKNANVAIKQVDVFENDDFTELDIIKRVKHPNIVSAQEMWLEPNTDVLNIVMPFAKCDLEHIKISPASIPNVLFQLIDGLHFLHSNGILHLDIKPDNILFFSDTNTVKYTDFGLSVYVDTSSTIHHGQRKRVTPTYAPPELQAIKNYNYVYSAKTDIWSLGIVFIRILTNKYPFQIYKQTIIYKPINYTEIQNKYGDSLVSLLKSMLSVNENKRATTNKLIKHPYFEGHKVTNGKISNPSVKRTKLDFKPTITLIELIQKAETFATFQKSSIRVLFRFIDMYYLSIPFVTKEGKQFQINNIHITKHQYFSSLLLIASVYEDDDDLQNSLFRNVKPGIRLILLDLFKGSMYRRAYFEKAKSLQWLVSNYNTLFLGRKEYFALVKPTKTLIRTNAERKKKDISYIKFMQLVNKQ